MLLKSEQISLQANSFWDLDFPPASETSAVFYQSTQTTQCNCKFMERKTHFTQFDFAAFCFLLCAAAELISSKLYICLSPFHREMRKPSELTLLLAFLLLPNSRLFFGIVKRIVSKWAEDVIRCKIVFAFFISISLWVGGMSAHTTFSITTYAPLYAGCCWMQQSIKSVSGVKIFHFAGMYSHSISLVRSSIICVQNPPGLSSPNSPLSLLFRAWI